MIIIDGIIFLRVDIKIIEIRLLVLIFSKQGHQTGIPKTIFGTLGQVGHRA